MVLGGPIGVYEADAYPFLTPEIELIARRLHADRPTLGICLGSQLLAAALGARVYSSGVKEIGWAPIELSAAGEASCLRHLEKTAVLHWHGDTFDLPAEAVRLASTPVCKNQAFSWRAHALALQFHAETAGTALESWYVGHTGEIAATPGISVPQLRADTARGCAPARSRGRGRAASRSGSRRNGSESRAAAGSAPSPKWGVEHRAHYSARPPLCYRATGHAIASEGHPSCRPRGRGPSGLTDTGSIDAKTGLEIERLRFSPEAEAEFATYFSIQRSLARARWATAIYLALVAVVTAINMRGSMAPLGEQLQQPIYLLRLGVACPALVLILAATVIPELQRHYQWITATAVIVTGMSVMAISGIAAANELPQFQMGDVLVVVYATLFLGLLWRAVVVLAASALMLSFIGIGWYLHVPTDHLIFASSVVFATTLMSVLSALRMERLLRANFIENRLLNDIAERDGLSGLYNRRMFDNLTNRLWLQAQRNQDALQIILVDIDHFKAYNDLYGHQAGDTCIRRVSSIIARAAKRPFDFCARYGGEEFALVLYAPSGNDPTSLPEQIRRDTWPSIFRTQTPTGPDADGQHRLRDGAVRHETQPRRPHPNRRRGALSREELGRNRVLHVDSAESDTPTGAFKVLAIK